MPRKKGEPDPPAGYGMVAVIDDLTEVHTMAGDVTLNTPGVGTITKYLAELVAVLHALNWATYSPEARDRPVCVRITGDYGVNIASGTWRPGKHKAMAQKAQRVWKALYRSRPGEVWIRHTPLKIRKNRAGRVLNGSAIWMKQAEALAQLGRAGLKVNAQTVD